MSDDGSADSGISVVATVAGVIAIIVGVAVLMYLLRYAIHYTRIRCEGAQLFQCVFVCAGQYHALGRYSDIEFALAFRLHSFCAVGVEPVN